MWQVYPHEGPDYVILSVEGIWDRQNTRASCAHDTIGYWPRTMLTKYTSWLLVLWRLGAENPFGKTGRRY